MANIVIGMVALPDMTLLDFAGPLEVFSKMRDTTVHVLWKRPGPVVVEGRAMVSPTALVATTAFADCPDLDVIFVPGGPGQIEVMLDDEVLGFLRDKAERATWVTSVCTGSLVLGAAGLLRGYRAGCHWMSRDQLALFGAVPVAERVVIDRDRATGGGVTAGIDFAFELVARIQGRDAAERLMLVLEYAPAPPFDGGTPDRAPAGMAEAILTAVAPLLDRRRRISEEAAARLDRTACRPAFLAPAAG